MKDKKFQQLVEEVSEYIADVAMRNHHYLYDEDIVQVFAHYKKKHVKRALKEVR